MNKYIKRAIFFTFLIFIWWRLSLYYSPLFVPSPVRVIKAGGNLISNGQLWIGILYSFKRITIATCLSSLLALPLGLFIYNIRTLKEVLEPLVNIMRYIPITAFYPLLIMWFGIEESMKIAFLFLATFLYMLPSVLLALNEVPLEYIEVGLTVGLNRFQIIYMVLLPSILPSILQTFIMMYGIGWTYIAVAEEVNAGYGLGFIITVSSARGRTDAVFFTILIIMVISIIFDYITNKIIRKVFDWKFVDNENYYRLLGD